MRPSLFTMALLAALLVTAGAWRHIEDQRRERQLIEATRIARMRIHSELRLRSALNRAEVSPQGWVTTVDPAWFGPPPINPLLDHDDRPWLDVDLDAGPHALEPRELDAGRLGAQWWYNPANGRVCARVPAQSTSSATRELAHQVND